MIKKLRKLKKDPLFLQIAGEKNKNLLLVLMSIIPAVVAGLMEGFSYGTLLLAVNILRGESVASMPFASFLMRFVKELSQNRQFLFFIIFALIIQVIRSVFLFLSSFIVSKLSVKITTNIQCKIYEKIFSFSYPFVSKYQSGDLLNYNSAPAIIPGLLGQVNSALSCLTLGLISLACLIKIDPILTLFLLFFFFLVNFIYKVILKKMTNLSMNLTRQEVKFSSQTNQNINGMKLIHMFSRQNYIVEKTGELLKKIAFANSRIIFWKTLIISFGEIIGIIVITLMLIFGAFLLRQREGFISFLLIFIFISYRFAARLQIFMNSIGEISSYKGSSTRLADILNDEDKEYIPTSGIKLEKFSKNIKLQNLSFTYNDRKKMALNDLSYSFDKGKTYAIIGKSGAGKSTLIDLLLNLYGPTKGSIIVDGLDLNKISLNSWREKIGIVNQDLFLFHDSIEDNIKFGNYTASKDQVVQASKLSNCHDFIMKLPKKYQTIVGEKGHKLSGGERQRVALARALIKNPDILILDEATSQLDSHSEKLIQTAIDNLRSEKTIIIIAHRLSTIVNADEILVLSDGKLIESGSHNKLLEKRGQYAYFWNIQSNTSSDKKNIFEEAENIFN